MQVPAHVISSSRRQIMAKTPLAAVVAVDHDGLWIRCIRATLLMM